jgi:hypothetical protein
MRQLFVWATGSRDSALLQKRCGKTVAASCLKTRGKPEIKARLRHRPELRTFNTIETGKFQIDCAPPDFATAIAKMQKPRMQPGLLRSRAKGLALSFGLAIWETNTNVF